MLKDIHEGASLFGGITAGAALGLLRHILARLGVAEAESYRTHDLRRGHARDLQLHGASLYEILQAGEWRSPAFLKVHCIIKHMQLLLSVSFNQYLDVGTLERDTVLEAHLDESSDEGD